MALPREVSPETIQWLHLKALSIQRIFEASGAQVPYEVILSELIAYFESPEEALDVQISKRAQDLAMGEGRDVIDVLRQEHSKYPSGMKLH